MLMDLFTLWSIVSLLVLVYVMIFRNTPQSRNERLKVVQPRVLRTKEPKLVFVKRTPH